MTIQRGGEASAGRNPCPDEWVRKLVEDSPDAIFLKDVAGRYVLMNDAAAGLFGRTRDEVVGLTDTDLFGVEAGLNVVEHDERVARAREAIHYETTRTLNGESHVFFTTKFPILSPGGDVVGIAGITRDVTAQRKRIEAQLLTADRMAAVGRLAASVGHEINNPLTYVLANIELIEQDLEASALAGAAVARIQARLREVREGSERVRDIVRDLKTFSRGEDDRRTPIDVHAVLDRSLSMAAHEIRHRARVVKRYGCVRPVHANEARLGQVFLNLLVNAAQAIPEDGWDGHEVRVTTELDARGHVVVEVRDTGVGITQDVLERVFEPFFTTKPAGTGTGLGLSISSEIVRALGGTIAASAALPRGTSFRVTLPVAEADASEARAGDESGAREVAGIRARVLIIDDEPPLARVLGDILSDHDVTIAFSARDAIRRLGDGPSFDVILCDLQMTDLSGIDVYEHVLAHHPSLAPRVLFMTGGVFTWRARSFMEATARPCLEKPFVADTVLRMVREILDRNEP